MNPINFNYIHKQAANSEWFVMFSFYKHGLHSLIHLYIAGWIPTSRSSLDPDRLLLLSLVQMVANRKWPGMEQGGKYGHLSQENEET